MRPFRAEESASHWLLGPWTFDRSRERPSCRRLLHKVEGRCRRPGVGLVSPPEPMVFRDTASKTSVSALLHLFNFLTFGVVSIRLPVRLPGAAWWCSIPTSGESRSSHWLGNATQQAWEANQRERRMWEAERKDGKPFSSDEPASNACSSPTSSRSPGAEGARACEVGFDAAGAKTWESLASPHCSNPPHSWFNPFQGESG